jgi:hypothetical protein
MYLTKRLLLLRFYLRALHRPVSAGCRTILLDNGNETEQRLSKQRIRDYLVRDLEEAAVIIPGDFQAS